MARVFVVVEMSEMTPNLSQKGEEFFSTSRRSLDGLKAILDYNHKEGYVNSLFVPNPKAYFDSLPILTHQQARELVSGVDWFAEELI